MVFQRDKKWCWQCRGYIEAQTEGNVCSAGLSASALHQGVIQGRSQVDGENCVKTLIFPNGSRLCSRNLFSSLVVCRSDGSVCRLVYCLQEGVELVAAHPTVNGQDFGEREWTFEDGGLSWMVICH